MAQEISRRHLGQLLVVALAGFGVGQYLQRAAPIGRDVGSSSTAKAVLQDKASPSREVDRPTLTLAVFTDYQCPACKLANTDMDAAVQKDGHVRIVYKDWPIFGAISERAARIAIASDRQGIYAALHASLMNERRALGDQVLREAVTALGGDWARIESDLQIHARSIDGQLNRNRRDAFQLGISGTPSYLSGSILVTGRLSEAEFARLFARGRESIS